MTMARRLFNLFASIEFTIFSIALMMVLVIVGTLGQVNIGTFQAQQTYFNHFFLYIDVGGVKIPAFPGGLLIGLCWFLALTASLVSRFTYMMKNTGILLIHVGLMVMLLGQFVTQTGGRESQMSIEEGQTKNYTEAPRLNELAFTDTSNAEYDEVITVPTRMLHQTGLVSDPKLPFSIDVRQYFANAELKMDPNGSDMVTHGIGKQISAREIPVSHADDTPNQETAIIELRDGVNRLGTWLVSSTLGAPQSVTLNGKTYSIALRPKRTYYPFSLTLHDFRHDRYPGTDIPKNFSSQVRLTDPRKGEDRDVLIYMNHPLRYDGKTFYQASFGKDDTLSVLQVVENPAWLAPYISCIVVVIGLGLQFVHRLRQSMRKPS
jgi:hypothetical protein